MPTDAYNRFIRSMEINYEKWHDGVGYDLEALGQMTDDERKSIAARLQNRRDWRDVEALAAIGDEPSVKAVEAAVLEAEPDARMKALRKLHDQGKITDEFLEQRLLEELKVVEPYGGMTGCFFLLDEVNTPRIRCRVLWCVIHRGDAAVNMAGKLYHLSGKTDEEFDWSQRPLFLRCAGDEAERDKAIEELAALCGMQVADAA